MTEEQKHRNKILLDEAWAFKFISKRYKKYWPDAKKLIAVEVKILKVFLNYLRFTARYRIFIENRHGKIEEKKIIAKAERLIDFKLPPRIGKVERDFLATKFLRQRGLEKILPRPLEFYKPLRAYLYEEISGQPLKNYIQKGSWHVSQYLSLIPSVMRTLKKIHSIKQHPPYASGDQKESIRNEINDWLLTITKYYPAGQKRAAEIVNILTDMKKKHAKNIFDKNRYRITHGDFQNDNIIVGDKNTINFIDFSDSKRFNPLDDLASFLVQAELHLRYVKPKIFRSVAKKLREASFNSYFNKKITPQEEMQIDFFAAKDVLRIITFVSFTQKPWQTVRDHSRMMDSLISFAEEKVKNLEKKYL